MKLADEMRELSKQTEQKIISYDEILTVIRHVAKHQQHNWSFIYKLDSADQLNYVMNKLDSEGFYVTVRPLCSNDGRYALMVGWW